MIFTFVVEELRNFVCKKSMHFFTFHGAAVFKSEVTVLYLFKGN